MEQLTMADDARGYYHLGYMRITRMLQLYWHAFELGLYTEILAYSEAAEDATYWSELYIRIPCISTRV